MYLTKACLSPFHSTLHTLPTCSIFYNIFCSMFPLNWNVIIWRICCYTHGIVFIWEMALSDVVSTKCYYLENLLLHRWYCFYLRNGIKWCRFNKMYCSDRNFWLLSCSAKWGKSHKVWLNLEMKKSYRRRDRLGLQAEIILSELLHTLDNWDLKT